MKLIFLDIDGVLNDHRPYAGGFNRIENHLADRLQRVLESTDARLVISSAWRYMVHQGSMLQSGFRNLLYSHGIDGGRMVGITGLDRSTESECRGELISEWIAGNVFEPLTYVVVDDLDLGITACGHPFVQTDGKVGMTESDAARLVAILSDGATK